MMNAPDTNAALKRDAETMHDAETVARALGGGLPQVAIYGFGEYPYVRFPFPQADGSTSHFDMEAKGAGWEALVRLAQRYLKLAGPGRTA